MNVLDLGVWMSLQAMVDKPHHMHMCEAGALVHSMNDTWEMESWMGVPQTYSSVSMRFSVWLWEVEVQMNL